MYPMEQTSSKLELQQNHLNIYNGIQKDLDFLCCLRVHTMDIYITFYFQNSDQAF